MNQLPIIEKVTAFITRGNYLLVFTERCFTEVGHQIPGGTVESGEDLEEAILREVYEESGLSKLKVNKYLGSCDVDQRKYGHERIAWIHCFHLICNEDTPETWSHEEKTPSETTVDTPERIFFDYQWVKLDESATHLGEDILVFLPEVVELVKSPNHT